MRDMKAIIVPANDLPAQHPLRNLVLTMHSFLMARIIAKPVWCCKGGGTVTVDRPGRYKIADTVFIGDGINWVWVQDEPVYECGVRNVVFRDIFLHQPRTAFSVHFNVGKFSRSYYPGAKPPKQEGIVFDNVQVL